MNLDKIKELVERIDRQENRILRIENVFSGPIVIVNADSAAFKLFIEHTKVNMPIGERTRIENSFIRLVEEEKAPALKEMLISTREELDKMKEELKILVVS